MKYIKTENIKEGMKLARDLHSESGKLLLRKGTELSSYKDYFAKAKIKTICVIENNESIKTDNIPLEIKYKLSNEIRQEIDIIFKYCTGDKYMMMLANEVIEFLIWDKWYEQ